MKDKTFYLILFVAMVLILLICIYILVRAYLRLIDRNKSLLESIANLSALNDQLRMDRHLTSQSLSALEERLDPECFTRCHKSYIIRMDAIRKLEVYGRWTYSVTLKETEETALMTAEKYDEIKRMFSPGTK